MKKIITIVLDGFGLRDEIEGNAVKQALMPNFNKLWDNYPCSMLEASGEAVGLPSGQFGNSEVGHMAIGAGRLVKQKEVLIDELLSTGEFAEDQDLLNAFNDIKEHNRKTHLMILCSDGGVHAQVRHLIKMLEILKEQGITNVYLHLITDGRDTNSLSAYKYISQVKDAINTYSIGEIATICGRYYAMDRDNNWNRTKQYYDLITRGIGVKTNAIMNTIQTCYIKNITDEFLPPLLINEDGLIGKNDALIWLNYRTDRAKQILSALTNQSFDAFAVDKMPNLKLTTMFPVDKSVVHKPILDWIPIENTLGVYLSNLGMTQARIAETEKFSHVTTFFDGEYQKTLDNCDRYLMPSPKVATYDQAPEMAALEICKKTISSMEKDYDFILVNFANPDMVGHTGDMLATIKGLQAVDLCLGKIIESAEENFYTIVLLADHGNADIMVKPDGDICTTHTSSKVPFIITDPKLELIDGDLTQVAPTILDYMDIARPKEMKETPNLFKKNKQESA